MKARCIKKIDIFNKEVVTFGIHEGEEFEIDGDYVVDINNNIVIDIHDEYFDKYFEIVVDSKEMKKFRYEFGIKAENVIHVYANSLEEAKNELFNKVIDELFSNFEITHYAEPDKLY